MTARLAVVGDVHLRFDDEDVRRFNAAGYDLVLFVGDLAGYSHRRGLGVARTIARLTCPAVVLPGNHDGVHPAQLGAEVAGIGSLSDALSAVQARRVEELRRALGAVPLVGYTVVEHRGGAVDLSLVCARPHSMGGPGLAFARYLGNAHGVATLEQSAARLRELIDGAGSDRLVVLAHNGPTGLGSRRSDIWGCDFRRQEGDFGDPDLRDALDHARRCGRRVVAVLAGHMHHRLRGGGARRWCVERDGTLFVNAARVPRIFERDGRLVRHHVAVEIDADGARAREVLW